MNTYRVIAYENWTARVKHVFQHIKADTGAEAIQRTRDDQAQTLAGEDVFCTAYREDDPDQYTTEVPGIGVVHVIEKELKVTNQTVVDRGLKEFKDALDVAKKKDKSA